ncbi:MAG: peptide deformylase [Oscillospiraceae bacterium]|jgi:peptide deformylase|nr:peptide deformylase [Oscillospiraceae bacterium]
MAIRSILQDDDPALRKKSRPVTEFNARLHQLLDDLRDTLLEADGLGLAAPQVGVLRRVALVVDAAEDENGDYDGDSADESVHDNERHGFRENIIELINPEIICRGGEQIGQEGCLSVPGTYGVVERPMTVRVLAADRFGNPVEYKAEGLFARAMCHEIDHLDGVIFTDVARRLLTDEELERLRAGEKIDFAKGI